MHILIIPSWYPNRINPLNGNFIEKQVELISSIHQVSVITISLESVSEITIEKTELNNFTRYNLVVPAKFSRIKKYFQIRKSIKKILKELKDVDVVHNFVLLNKGFLTFWIKNKLNKPLIVTEHASYLLRENHQKLNLIDKFKIAFLLRKAKRVSVVSELLKEELEYLFKLKNVYLTPNVIDRDLFHIEEQNQDDILKFIHVSTLDPLKNASLMLDGFDQFYRDTKQNFELTLVAELENETIKKQLISLEISNKVKIIGPLTSWEVADHIKKSDALILLSEYETFSCVIAEAWACGIPVISTKVGIAKNMGPEAGIVIDFAGKNEFVKALNEFCSRKSQFNKENIRALSVDFGVEHGKLAFEKLYNSL